MQPLNQITFSSFHPSFLSSSSSSSSLKERRNKIFGREENEDSKMVENMSSKWIQIKSRKDVWRTENFQRERRRKKREKERKEEKENFQERRTKFVNRIVILKTSSSIQFFWIQFLFLLYLFSSFCFFFLFSPFLLLRVK